MNLKLTKKAIEEKDKLTAREISSINFSKMAVGSGLYTSEELANEITELRMVEITTEIVNVYQEMVDIKNDVPNIDEETVKKESQLFITSTFFNKDVEEKFEVREVGIYFISNEDKQEYLYAYYIVASTDTAIAIVQDKSLPQYMPISVNTKLSNIDEVNIAVVNDMLVVNQDEFKRYKVDIKKHIDDEDISIRTYVDEEDRKIKTSIIEQDTSIRTYINERDAIVKTYVDVEDAKIETLVNTKANSSHTHSLSSGYLTGVLPTSKGGTGRTDGGANAYVYSSASNPTYLLGTSSSSSYPTLYRVNEDSYIKHINMQSSQAYSNHVIHQAPYNGWIRAYVQGNSMSVIKIGSHPSYINDSLDSAIAFSYKGGGFIYAPIRAGYYFRTEWCNLGVRLYREVS